MNNPYTPNFPIQDAGMFFGRECELIEIGAFLRNNQSISLVGPHKIGKTSLMLHLMRPETATRLGIESENLFVYLNCESLSNCQLTDIFTLLCNEIARSLQNRSMEPEPALNAVISKPTWLTFNTALRRLDQRSLRLIFMLDDFEQLTTNPYLEVSFYNALRSITGRLRVVFLTASRRPLIELTFFESAEKVISSPFFNIFAQLFLDLLPEVDAHNLIRQPIEASGLSINARLENFIYDLVGGHPLALQIACFHAWDNPENLERIELLTRRDLEVYFQGEK